jgi:hypothetical protein
VLESRYIVNPISSKNRGFETIPAFLSRVSPKALKIKAPYKLWNYQFIIVAHLVSTTRTNRT